MKQRIVLRKSVLDLRLQEPFEDYMDHCILAVEGISSKRILDGIGELLDPELKKWVKNTVIFLIKIY